MRTLLVEDDSTTRHLLSELLVSSGYEVTAVDDVASGLAAHRTAPFPLIVTDWLMEGLPQDGLDLCRAVREAPGGDEVFLLVVSIRNAEADLDSVLDAGADDYIAKPVDPATFRMRLRVAQERIGQKRARRQAERALRTVVSHAPLILMTVDGSGVFTFADGQGLATLNQSGESLVGHPVRAKVPAMTDPVERALGGETLLTEIVVNGVTLESWFAPAPNGSSFAPAQGAIVVCTDVTERRRIEQEIREGEERFRRFAEAAFEGIIVVQEGRIVDCNDQFAAITGYRADEIPGRVVSTFVHADDLDAVEEFVRSVPEDPIHHRAVRKDGAVVRVEARVRPTRLHGVDAVIAAIQDITARERAAVEREALTERLQQSRRLEALGVLAGGIAHDFNNLLMGVMGNASLAQMEVDSTEAAEYIQRIEEAAHKAADLTNQMLAFSGRGKFVISSIDLAEVVRAVRDDFADRTPSGVGIEFDLSEGVPPVEGDATQIQQAVQSLVANAVESYLGQPGTVVVRAGIRAITTDTLERASGSAGEPYRGERVFVDVEDRGCGMDSRTVARVFDPFFSTKFAGRGLGMAAVMGIVRGHGGSVAVNSAPGKGTTVSLYLPFAPADSPDDTDPGDVHPPDRNGAVLVIDDEPGVRDVTRVMLERHGYRVITAETGREGVEAFQRAGESVAVTLLDLTMPDLSGAAVFKQIKAIEPGARIVLMSGYDEERATKEFSEAGLSGFLHKPFAASALAEKIGEVLTA